MYNYKSHKKKCKSARDAYLNITNLWATHALNFGPQEYNLRHACYHYATQSVALANSLTQQMAVVIPIASPNRSNARELFTPHKRDRTSAKTIHRRFKTE